MKTGTIIIGVVIGVLLIGAIAVGAVMLTGGGPSTVARNVMGLGAGDQADSGRQVAPPPRPDLPLMELQAQFAGPFTDTIIQRWRDPIDGATCYLYIPVRLSHEPPEDGQFLDYGSNSLGSISCVPPSGATAPAAAPAQ